MTRMQFKHNGYWVTNMAYTPSLPKEDRGMTKLLTGMFGCKEEDLLGMPQIGKRDSVWVDTNTRLKSDMVRECQRLVKKAYGFTSENIDYA